MRPDTPPDCVFAAVPPSWEGRWSALRELVRRWHGLALGPVGSGGAAADRAQARIGRPLPPSVREWIALGAELEALGAEFVLRDPPQLAWLDAGGALALALMVSGEEDFAWAVWADHLDQDDPPVEGFALEPTGAPGRYRAMHEGPSATLLTGFALEHLAYALDGDGGGFLVTIRPTAGFLTAMSQAFPVATRFGSLAVFESPDLLALIITRPLEPDTAVLVVEAQRALTARQIPECLWDQTGRGGAFRGPFARLRRR